VGGARGSLAAASAGRQSWRCSRHTEPVAGFAYGALLNLWFWPFLSPGAAPTGAGFVPGDSAAANAVHYGVFYLATSLGWDVPRAVVTAALVLVAGRPILATLRRAVRRAAFDEVARFD
jgi:energy-coupling factor transport system substrate-specific component